MTEQHDDCSDKKAKKPADEELVALKRIGSILAKLPAAAQRRVLDYCVNRAISVV